MTTWSNLRRQISFICNHSCFRLFDTTLGKMRASFGLATASIVATTSALASNGTVTVTHTVWSTIVSTLSCLASLTANNGQVVTCQTGNTTILGHAAQNMPRLKSVVLTFTTLNHELKLSINNKR